MKRTENHESEGDQSPITNHQSPITNLRWNVAQAAEIRWWQGYLKKKPKADYLAWKGQYWRDLLTRIDVQPRVGEHVLDVGCGPAGAFIVLPENQVDAVDPLLDNYEEKLEHFDKTAYPNTSFYSQPFETFQSDTPYDTILCLNAINHVADLDLCFDKLVELTKPGGTLVVSIDAHNYAFFKYIFRLLPGDILHPHQYDLTEYEAMLTSRNCDIKAAHLFDEHFFFNYYVLVAQRKTIL